MRLTIHVGESVVCVATGEGGDSVCVLSADLFDENAVSTKGVRSSH